MREGNEELARKSLQCVEVDGFEHIPFVHRQLQATPLQAPAAAHSDFSRHGLADTCHHTSAPGLFLPRRAPHIHTLPPRFDAAPFAQT